MNIERLQTLSKFLRTIPQKSFKMSVWVSNNNEPDVTEHIHQPDKNECGFAGCAMGWACQIPEFRDLGLKLKTNRYRDWFYPSFDSSIEYTEDGFRTAELFFGINDHQSSWLFEGISYETGYEDHDDDWDAEEFWDSITPQQVADRIDKLIENDGRIDEDHDEEWDAEWE